MLIVLTGSNDYLRSAKLRQFVSDYIELHDEFGLERIDAGEADLKRMLEDISSVPFLADKRMIIISNILSNKGLVERIDQLIELVPDTTDLVIDESKFDKRTSLYKTLKSKTDFHEFNELDGGQLASWLVEEAKTRGGELSLVNARHLIERAGLNQMGLSHELDKLLTGDYSISRDSIDHLVHPVPSSTMFELLDAAFSGNHHRAIALYHDQRQQKIEPQAILGMIAWQVHIIALVKFNQSQENLALKVKLNPYVVSKTKKLTDKITEIRVKNLVSDVLDVDYRLKTESIDADDAIQYLILTL